MLRYFDSHCHPQLPQFDSDRQEVLFRMQEKGVGGLVVGVDLETSKQAAQLAHAHDFLWAAVGLHPNDAPDEAFEMEEFRVLAQKKRVVAIGECGLDFYRNEPTKEEYARQMEQLERHVALAEECAKPLIIHCRPTKDTHNAHQEMIAFLNQRRGLPVVIHFFTSTEEIARQYLDLGCYLSFPGVITFTDMYNEAIRTAPLDRILSETDSPFAAPVPYRGHRNEPVYVMQVIDQIAKIKNSSLEGVQHQILQNALHCFGIEEMGTS